MAEFVELRAEEWIPELEMLERLKLINSKEVKSFIRRKKEFRYKLQRQAKSKEDFLKYIQFEINFYKILRSRRQKWKIYTNSDIDVKQTKHIAKLFKEVIFRHQDDIKLWMSFFTYCSETDNGKLGSRMLPRMLQIHANKEKVWAFASKWEFDKVNSMETARQFLLAGLRHHPTSERLYEELFKLELKYAVKRKEDMDDEETNKKKIVEINNITDVISGKLALVVYEDAVMKINRIEFKVRLFNISTEFPEMKEVQNNIFCDLVKNHIEEELTWEVMAKKEAELMAIKYINDKCSESNVDNELDLEALKERMEKTVAMYEQAVSRVNTKKMWSLYIKHIITMCNETNALTAFKSNILQKVFEGAVAARQLDEKYFLQWIEILNSMGGKTEKLGEVLEKATEHYPQSVRLWYARLRHYFTRDQEEIASELFKEAIKRVPNNVKALPLWKLMIQYYQTRSSPKVMKTFEAAFKRGGELAQKLKPMCLQWVARIKGLPAAKKLFESPEMLYPPCLELINEMISLESSVTDMNKKSLRRYHEMACDLAGKDNLDVWMNFIEFELKHGGDEGPFVLYLRATRTLNADLVSEFIARYNILKIES